MEPSELDDSDDSFDEIEESLSSLKASAKVADDAIVASLNRLKVAQYKLKLELDELSETELRTKPGLRAWLANRNLPSTCAFQEFFQAFLDEHKRDYRLDLSDRSIRLNTDACHLLGYKEKDKRVTILEIMERLPLLFH